MSAAAQHELNSPPSDAISSVTFSANASKLLVTSWDRNVYLYNTDSAASETPLLQKYEYRAPVLNACFGDDDGNVAYTVSLDGAVQRLDLSSDEKTLLSTHTMGAKALTYDVSHSMLLSASWDKTLHIHHPLSPNLTPVSLALPAKPFAFALTADKVVIAMSARVVHIYELAALSAAALDAGPLQNGSLPRITVEPFQRRESNLKFMTRALAPMPDGTGYASGSIEGRVAVEWIDAGEESQARKYAFKCHRQKGAAGTDAEGKDVVYPVHALAFHPTNGTFVTGGGDGVVSLWDVLAKRRVRQYKQLPSSVAALAFSKDGKQLAMGVSPGFEEGKEEDGEDGSIRLYIRAIADDEAKEDKKKPKKGKENA